MPGAWLSFTAAAGLLLVAAEAAVAQSEQIEIAKVQAAMWGYMAFAISVTLVKITALILGYFIAKLGYTTMMTGVQGKDSVELGAFGAKFMFKGVTPGLALGIIGVLMMGWALSGRHHFSAQVETAAIQQETGTSTITPPAKSKKDASKRAPDF